jgi:hypothetical protein
MSAEQEWRIKCYQCGTRGPLGDSAGGARDAAEKEGWYIGQRGQYGREEDYCTVCRKQIDVEFCEQITESGSLCGSLAMYEIDLADHIWRSCGKHFVGILRDVFNGHPKDRLGVTRLRASINRKPE